MTGNGDLAEPSNRRPGVTRRLGNRRIAGGEVPGPEIIADLELSLRLLEHGRIGRLGQQRPADHAGLVGAAVESRVAHELRQLIPVRPVLHPAVLVPALRAESEHDLEVVQTASRPGSNSAVRAPCDVHTNFGPTSANNAAAFRLATASEKAFQNDWNAGSG